MASELRHFPSNVGLDRTLQTEAGRGSRGMSLSSSLDHTNLLVIARRWPQSDKARLTDYHSQEKLFNGDKKCGAHLTTVRGSQRSYSLSYFVWSKRGFRMDTIANLEKS